jgi:hypothetical protein
MSDHICSCVACAGPGRVAASFVFEGTGLFGVLADVFGGAGLFGISTDSGSLGKF